MTLVAVGATAAIAFPTMKCLNPTLPGFEAIGDHWSIAGGHIAQPLFAFIVPAGLALCVVSLLLALTVARGLPKGWGVGILGVGVLVLAVSIAAFVVQQEMTGHWQMMLTAILRRRRRGGRRTPHGVQREAPALAPVDRGADRRRCGDAGARHHFGVRKANTPITPAAARYYLSDIPFKLPRATPCAAEAMEIYNALLKRYPYAHCELDFDPE